MSSFLFSLQKEIESLSLELCELVLNNDECFDEKYELLVKQYKNSQFKFEEQLNIIQKEKQNQKQLKLEEITENISVKSMNSTLSQSSKLSFISTTNTTKTTKTNIGIEKNQKSKQQKSKSKPNPKQKQKKQNKNKIKSKKKLKFKPCDINNISFYHSSRKEKKEKKEKQSVPLQEKGCEYHSNVFRFHGNVYTTTIIKVIYKKSQNSLSRFNVMLGEEEIKAFLLNKNGDFTDNNIKKIEFYRSTNYVMVHIINKSLNDIKKAINVLNGKKFGDYTMFLRLINKKDRSKDDNNHPKNASLFVTNFDIVHDIQTKLENIFSRYSNVFFIRIKTDRNRNPFAIVEYLSIEDADRCLDDVKEKGIILNDRYLDINYSMF